MSRMWLAWMLLHRVVLFGGVQVTIAALLSWRSQPDAFERSAAWWPVSATIAGLVSLALLELSMRREGRSYLDLLRVERGTMARDVAITLGLLATAVVLAVVPNVGLAVALWGRPDAGAELFIRPLPDVVAWVTVVVFPLTIGASELPTYFGYVMPRLRHALPAGRGWIAVLACAGALSLQHITLPLLLDLRFVVWRALMFLPFALVLAFALRVRPRLLPYLVVAHVLLDLTVALQVLALSRG